MAAMIFVDFQHCFIFILLCLFSLLCYTLFFKKPKNLRKVAFDLPPSPLSLPIIGHLHLLLSARTHKSFQKLSSKYGAIIHLRIFNIPIVLVSSASIAYEIFRMQDANISSRGPPPIEDTLFVGSSSFASAPYGDHWKFMKKLLVTKLLGAQALERSRDVRANELERFYKTLYDKATKEESVEIGKAAMKLINNSLCKMIMGRSCSEGNGEAERVQGLSTESLALIKKVLLGNMLSAPFKNLVTLLFRKEVMDLTYRFDELLERFLAEHEEKREGHQPTELIDALLAAYGEDNAEYRITRNHIKTLFVDLFVAGTDASTHTIEWVMAEIINNPKFFDRLRQEIDHVVGKTRLIQETDLPNIPYLHAIVKEGLRLHPPAPLVVRTFQEGCKVGGFYVPEKTTLVVNAYATMRDSYFWEGPDEFKPERFLSSLPSEQEEEVREETLKYLPFGSGRRGCPGANLAYVSVETAIGVMVQCFDWKIKEDKVNLEEAGGAMTLTMAHSLSCTPLPRIQIPLT